MQYPAFGSGLDLAGDSRAIATGYALHEEWRQDARDAQRDAEKGREVS